MRCQAYIPTADLPGPSSTISIQKAHTRMPNGTLACETQNCGAYVSEDIGATMCPS